MATAQVAPVKGETSVADKAAAKTVFESFYWLPCQANVEIPVPGFTVGDLLKLAVGEVVHTVTPSSKEVPIRINKIPLGSGKFEVVDERLAVRITEFA
ncbi:MAG TPA: FliM/FliN family flagellar motor C-terminal domain-containing protein [Candidatus Acidoferrales bacterium]|jgi:flagellar motor switch/type III secretory pathway protein FliN|nr:FliM/FliN family flagellar motor C-terminal domain-containing protein [Candidatus Acidoferrales bacterium]